MGGLHLTIFKVPHEWDFGGAEYDSKVVFHLFLLCLDLKFVSSGFFITHLLETRDLVPISRYLFAFYHYHDDWDIYSAFGVR